MAMWIIITASLFFTVSTAVAACTSGLDCSLNGVCANGACACDPGWHGPACELLSLGASPASAAQGAAYGFGKPFATTSWGGNAIFAAGGDEQWHLFVTEIAGAGCGLHAWQGQSTVVHATASSASGPYERVGVAVEHQAHNPQTIVINGRRNARFDEASAPGLSRGEGLCIARCELHLKSPVHTQHALQLRQRCARPRRVPRR